LSLRELVVLGCSSQQPTRKRNHGAYLLRWNEEGFLFDPGEGTQRQFIFAGVAPPCVTRIFISHFHGDHCLGLGSMLMRLNLDGVTHPIHCYYPASGKVYFDRLRFGTIYHENIQVIEHPVTADGLVHEDTMFRIEAYRLEHGVDNFGWRIQERDVYRFSREKLSQVGLEGPLVGRLEKEGVVRLGDKVISLADVAHLHKGAIFSIVIDTLPCSGALRVAHKAAMLLCESTYCEEHVDLAQKHYHMTAKQAARIALQAQAEHLILTHFSARYQDLRPFEEEARQIFLNTDVAVDFKKFSLRK
jgi:ribonuclease Z